MTDPRPSLEDAAAPVVPRSHRSALFIVFLVVFIDLLGFGIVLPILPLYGDSLIDPLFPGQKQLRGALLGLLMASFSFMQFIFAPVWGRISDRIGRRPILLLGLGGSVAFYALFGVASDIGGQGMPALGLVLIFVARLGAGMAGATISTAQSVIADSTPPEGRARGMALIGAAFGIGFTFGPLLGFASLFVDLDGAPGYAAAILSLIAFFLALRLLLETLKTGSPGRPRHWLDWHGLHTVLRTPSVGVLVFTFFLAVCRAFGGLESTLSLCNKLLLTGEAPLPIHLNKETARTTERSNFLVFAYVGFVLMLAQGFFYRRFVQRLGEVRFLRIGVVLMALGLGGAVGVLWIREDIESKKALLAIALATMTMAVTGFAFLNPSIHSLVSRRSDPAKQGEVLGVNQSAAALARIVGPMMGLSLFYLSPTHILPFAMGAGLLVIVFLVTLQLRQE